LINKKHRLRDNKDFSLVYRKGKSYASDLLVLYVLDKSNDFQAGFSISKKIGKAVVRNKIKRRLSEIIRLTLENFRDCKIVLIARKPITDKSYKEIEVSLQRLLKKAGLYK